MEKTEMMDSFESEEEREKRGSWKKWVKTKSTRPSDDAMFVRREIIDAIKRSDEKMETYSKKADENKEIFDEK